MLVLHGCGFWGRIHSRHGLTMRTRDPFGMALGSLRDAVGQGLAPAQHLPVGDIAQALKLSTSPVREALSRLCGEGLIEERRGLGYFTRSAPLEDILGLLDLEAAHVGLAVQADTETALTDADDAAVEHWISDLMNRCDNQPLVESYARVHHRLAPLRRLHGPVAVDPQKSGGDPIAAYYDRWRNAASGLASRVRRLEATAPEYTANRV